jgi:AraC-like DNA-binding protein
LVPGWDIETTPLLDLRGRPRVRTLLHEVVKTYTITGKYSHWRSNTLLSAAIAQLAHEASLLQDVANNPHLGADAVRRVQQARELLEEPRTTPYSIAEVAGEVGWSSDHLGRMCREVLGASPLRVQLSARMSQARRLLRQPNTSIAETSRRCGYKDVMHFMTVFKKEHGVTAREYKLSEIAAE